MPVEVFGPEALAFGVTKLLSELRIAEDEVRVARDWVARHRWEMYRERVMSWRYLITRGVPVYRVTHCRTCDRLVRFQCNRRAVCFACGQRWWVYL